MKLTGGNQSVEKTLHIIETLAEARSPMRLSELANTVGMPSSTVLRMVNTLIAHGYAFQEEEEPRRYGLTMRFLRIGQMVTDRFSLRDITHPYLNRLANETNESCCVATLDGFKVRYIDVVEGRNLVTIRQRVGGTGQMHCTGSGKLFLMQFTEEQLDEFIATMGLPKLTENTLVTKSDLLYDLSMCRERGYAVDDEECEIGMRCLAVPVYDENQRVIASLSVSGPIARMTRMRYERDLEPLLTEIAHKISVRIGGECQNNPMIANS